MPLVFVGAATQDALALVSSFPHPDERVVADDVVYAGGGPAATAAVAAVRLGAQAAFVGTVGDDDNGRLVLDGLVREGVDVTGVSVDPRVRTGASVIVVDRSRGARAICSLPAPEPVLNERASELIAAADWVHTDHRGWPALAAMPGYSERTWRLSVDVGYPVPSMSLDGVDLYVPSLDLLRATAAENATSTGSGRRQIPVEDLLRSALEAGAHTVVGTDGSRGSYGMSRDLPLVHIGPTAARIVSTLGAGDVFHGALLVAVSRGTSLPGSLAYANTVAALSCGALDGRSGIPDHATALSRLQS